MIFNFSTALRLLCLLGLSVVSLSAQARQDDGPYLTVDGKHLDAKWLCDGKLIQKQLSPVTGVEVPVQCGYLQSITVREQQKDFPVEHRFQANKIAALSDIHGQYASMKTLLQKHGVIDEQLRWSFGSGHLVITGDILDRGDQATDALWLLYSLEQQAKQHGGALHVLLGNHEVMVMANDLRYVHPKYLKVAQQLGREYHELFSEQTILGRWLRSKPVIIQVNDSLFMHAGLHPDILKLKMTIPQINEAFRSSLGLAKTEIKAQETLSFLYGSSGPIWYRGYFTTPTLPSAELEPLLQAFQVKRIVVGHTTGPMIHTRLDGKVVAIDGNIKSGKNGEILLFEAGIWTRGNLAGERLELSEAPVRSDAVAK